MKPLLINANDIQGGAARAAYRLNMGLKELGVESRMLVQFKTSSDPDIIGPQTLFDKLYSSIRPHLDALPVRLYRNRPLINFSPAILPDSISAKVNSFDPKIVHLHWITAGFIRIETLKKFNRPVIWTIHDLWAFTGGCHYAAECVRYRESCGMCPVLGSIKEFDLSHKIWRRKKKAWNEMNLTIISPSRWLAECARESSLLKEKRVEVIPNGIDIETYKPSDMRNERERLGFPQDKKLVLFGAVDATSDKRKGFNLLRAAFHALAGIGLGNEVELVVFGASEPAEKQDLGIKTNYMGYVQDEDKLVSLYAAADIFVAPSTQENLSNMVMESLACGMPVVAFDIGGMPDMIEHKKNGYLARPFDIKDLAHGIEWVLEDEKRRDRLARRARQKVEQEFELKHIAKRYFHLYNEILAKKNDKIRS